MIIRASGQIRDESLCELCTKEICPRCGGKKFDPVDHDNRHIIRPCHHCAGEGMVHRKASWAIEDSVLGLVKLCKDHAYAMGIEWTCLECGRTNHGLIARCYCGWTQPNQCRKCNRQVGEAVAGPAMVKLMDSTCKSCAGTGRRPCVQCNGDGICGTCEGNGCDDCNGSSFCTRCGGDTREPRHPGHPDPGTDDARDPSYACVKCEGKGVIERSSKSTRFGLASVDIRDIDKKYWPELEEHVGSYVCWTCANPDIVFSQWNPKDRICLICEKEGTRTVLSHWNSGSFCFKHTNYDICEQCQKRLEHDEPGPYCRVHAVCLKPGCGDKPMPWSVFCEVHRDIRGIGAMGERGGFSRQKSAKSSSGFSRIVSAKWANPATYIVKLEKLTRVSWLVRRRAEKQTMLRKERRESLQKAQDSQQAMLTAFHELSSGLDAKNMELEQLRMELNSLEAYLEEGRLMRAKLSDPAVSAEEKARIQRELADRPVIGASINRLRVLYNNKEAVEREVRDLSGRRLGAQTQLSLLDKYVYRLSRDLTIAEELATRAASTQYYLTLAIFRLNDLYKGYKYDPWEDKGHVVLPPKEELEPAPVSIECPGCRRRFNSFEAFGMTKRPISKKEAAAQVSSAVKQAETMAEIKLRKTSAFKSANPEKRASMAKQAREDAEKEARNKEEARVARHNRDIQVLCKDCRQGQISDRSILPSSDYFQKLHDRDVLNRDLDHFADTLIAIQANDKQKEMSACSDQDTILTPWDAKRLRKEGSMK